MPSTYQRRILHHGPNPQGTPVLLSGRTVQGCWFELLRQGGCGSGELELADRFDAPHDIFPGDWISFEYSPGERWYLGRIEEIESTLPAGRRLRLEGMSIELNEIFPGGFGESADGAKPHRYGATDLFTHDPDRSLETADSVNSPEALLRLLLNQYVVGQSHILVDTVNIDAGRTAGTFVSAKFRGEESIRTIIKDLAVRAGGASWGVDQRGEFFFLTPRLNSIAAYQQGQEIISLTQQTTREQLFNRILLTGDYVYDRRDYSGTVARRSYRWRANFVQPESRNQHGERRIRLWLPWIRTQQDARNFAREFFRTYANSQSTYQVEIRPQGAVPFPWLGLISLLDQNGREIARGQVETVRVSFDHAPSLRLEIGPIDPHSLWPAPPYDERWELPDEPPRYGGAVSLSQASPGGGGGGGSPSGTNPLTNSIFLSSQVIIPSLSAGNSTVVASWNSSLPPSTSVITSPSSGFPASNSSPTGTTPFYSAWTSYPGSGTPSGSPPPGASSVTPSQGLSSGASPASSLAMPGTTGPLPASSLFVGPNTMGHSSNVPGPLSSTFHSYGASIGTGGNNTGAGGAITSSNTPGGTTPWTSTTPLPGSSSVPPATSFTSFPASGG